MVDFRNTKLDSGFINFRGESISLTFLEEADFPLTIFLAFKTGVFSPEVGDYPSYYTVNSLDIPACSHGAEVRIKFMGNASLDAVSFNTYGGDQDSTCSSGKYHGGSIYFDTSCASTVNFISYPFFFAYAGSGGDGNGGNITLTSRGNELDSLATNGEFRLFGTIAGTVIRETATCSPSYDSKFIESYRLPHILAS